MYRSNNDNSLPKVNGGSSIDMDLVAQKVAADLDMSGKDGRIVSQNRKAFDKEFLAEVSGGASPEEAQRKAVGKVTLDLAKED